MKKLRCLRDSAAFFVSESRRSKSRFPAYLRRNHLDNARLLQYNKGIKDKSGGDSHEKTKAAALLLSMLTACSVPAQNAFAAAQPGVIDYEEPDLNYAKLLQYSLYFYDANMCGTDVTGKSRLSWRGNCHVYDAKVPMQPIGDDLSGTNLPASYLTGYADILDPDGDGYIDVAGGYHDAGDHVKFGVPETYAGSVVSWGYYEFRDAYEAIGEAAHTETIIRHFCDYFMKCTCRRKTRRRNGAGRYGSGAGLYQGSGGQTAASSADRKAD